MTDKSQQGAGAGERRPWGEVIGAVASRQHGVVSRSQLRAVGLSDTMVDGRLAGGTLHRLFRGVFAVGHRAVDRHGLMLAAVLACGKGAVVSHATAAELLGLSKRRPALIDVTSPGSTGRTVQGIRWHCVPLAPDEVEMRAGIPCTTASRTLVDMAGQYGEKSLRRLVEQGAFLQLLDVDAIDRVLARRRRRGAPTLRRLLAPWRTEGGRRERLRSTMEARMLAAAMEADVPPSRCNAVQWLDGERIEADFLWEEQRLVVETDGEETHGTPPPFGKTPDAIKSSPRTATASPGSPGANWKTNPLRPWRESAASSPPTCRKRPRSFRGELSVHMTGNSHRKQLGRK